MTNNVKTVIKRNEVECSMKKVECKSNCDLEALLLEGVHSGKSDEMKEKDWQALRGQLRNKMKTKPEKEFSTANVKISKNLVASLHGIVKNSKIESKKDLRAGMLKKHLGNTTIPRKFGV